MNGVPAHRDWLIYGSGTFAETVADLITDCGGTPLGCMNDFSAAGAAGLACLGSFEAVTSRWNGPRPAIALGIGYKDLDARWNAWQRMKATGWPTPALVHPQAYVARSARIEAGAMVMARAIVDRAVSIAECCVLWPGACLNHNVEMAENCFVSPGAVVCGHVRIGAHTFVGAGSLIADRSTIPARSFLKMGSHCSWGRK